MCMCLCYRCAGDAGARRAKRRGGPNGESRRRSWIGRASKSRSAQNGEVEVGREKELEEKIEVARGQGGGGRGGRGRIRIL
ncbi:hypothetical protein V8C44DRAFT_342162 [Trichoderma aethiopicum]